MRVSEAIVAREIGDPISFEISFCSPVDMRERWNSQRPLSGGGVIIDNGSAQLADLGNRCAALIKSIARSSSDMAPSAATRSSSFACLF